MNEYSYLGIVLDSMMTLSTLFARTKKRVLNKIYMLIKIRNHIDTQCAVAI